MPDPNPNAADVDRSDWLDRAPTGRRAAFRCLHGLAGAMFGIGRAAARLAVGVLRNADVRRAEQREWATYNTGDMEVDVGLSAWERRLYAGIDRHDRVMVIGCGAGREVIALARRGIATTGLDPVPSLIAQARRHLARHELQADLIVAAIEQWNGGATFDVCIVSNFTYGLIRPRAVRIRALETIRRHLTPRGRVLASVRPPSRTNRTMARLVRMINAVSATDWRIEPGDVVFALDGAAGVSSHHAFAHGEVEREVEDAGFTIVSDEAVDGARCLELRPRPSATPAA